MELDDEDPEWLEACMLAVDRIPVANLDAASKTSAVANSNRPSNAGLPVSHVKMPNNAGSSSSNSSVTDKGTTGGDGRSSLYSSSLPATPSNRMGAPMAASVASSVKGGRCHTGSKASSVYPAFGSRPPTERGSGGSASAGTASWKREGPSTLTSKAGEGSRRFRGVGVNPDDNVQCKTGQGELDPCWKCGESSRLMEFGSDRFYGCSGRPLCKATRRGRKNGAIIELVAEERQHASSGCNSSDRWALASDNAENSGITRCQLSVRVRGGHHGGAADAAWDMLRRNGIVPTQDGNHADASGGSVSGDVGIAAERAQELKAVLDLGQRDSVRRLASKAGMAYRDVPQSTYSHLMSSGAGASTRGEGKAKADARSLEELGACEAMMYLLPAGLRRTLLPFQRDGVLFGLRRKGRCIIADEMGTGKTLQALGVMGCYRDSWPLLIVAPASMRLMWAEEVEHWYPFLPPSEVHLIKGNKDKLYLSTLSRHLWPRVVVVSYFMLRMLADSVGKGDWKAVIFDESHTIRTKLGDDRAQSQQVTVCMEVAKRAQRVVMLSGTPSMSKPFDLFNQMEAISPGLLGQGPLYKAKHAFASNYCGGTMCATRTQMAKNGGITRVPVISGSGYPDELHLLLKNEVMIRRLKANVVDQLPPLRRIVVRVAEHGGELKKALESGGYDADPEECEEGLEGITAGAVGADETARGGPRGRRAGTMGDDQRAGLKKVRSASEWIVDKLISSQETMTKFVVLAHHKTVLDRLQEAFEMAGTRRPSLDIVEDDSVAGFTCLRIDGQVPTALRASRLSEFNTNEACRILLVSITAGGQGLDFTAASNAVFVELPESPAWLRQAEDRLHRRNQVKGVNVYLTVLPPGSHDDTRWLSLSERLLGLTSVVNGTAEAENIDVDRVFDAGGLLLEERQARLRTSRCRHRRVASTPRNEADGHGAKDGAPASDGIDASDSASDVSGTDASGDVWDGYECADNGVAETDLDAEMRAALATPPLDPPTRRPSQSPTLRLLRAIGNSPAPPHPNGKPGKPSARSKVSIKKYMAGSCGEPLRGRREKGAKTAALAQAARKGEQRVGQAPGSRKRPRSSPGPADATKGRGNPFTAYRLPAPPPRSFSRDRNGATEQCAKSSRGWSVFDMPEDSDDDIDITAFPKSGGKLRGSSTMPKQGNGRVRARSSRRESVHDMLPEDSDDDIDFTSIRKSGGRVRGSPERPKQGDGAASSPYTLVDLSSIENDEPSGVGAEEGGGPVEQCLLDSFSMTPSEAPLSRESCAGGDTLEGADKPLSPPFSPSWGRGQSSKNETEGEERGEKEDEEGGGVDKQDEKAGDILLASKLSFLVSVNTGRVHVYQEQDNDGEAFGVNDSFEEEDRRPLHCRCNFRPEDLDRLFEAAKGAVAALEPPEPAKQAVPPASSTIAVRPSLGKGPADHVEALAREVLKTLPDLLRSAPALRVARAFVQEWRALPSRQRPLFKGRPCRPPLADELARVTPQLTGSVRRYAERPKSTGDKEHDDPRTKNNRSSKKVMCLFCEEEPASEQEPAVHRRDRFCSVECMEAHGSRSGNTSLRRLVVERDHGICSQQGCRRDCLSLVSRLKSVKDRQKRRDILIRADPRFGVDRNRSLRERLILQPRAGNAWNADHVTAVYQGGGECGVDNLRTLCVLCHSEVTREQTTERAASRRASKEAARRSLEEAQGQRRLVSFGGGMTLSGSQGSCGGGGSGGQGSPGDICEISSDESDCDDAASLPPGRGPLNARTAGDGLKMSNSKRGRFEGTGRSGSRGKGGRGGAGTRSLLSPSLEAFERLFSGEEFPVGSPVVARNPRSGGVSSRGVQNTDRGTAGGRVASAVKSGGGASDGFEIALTRVVRAPRRSCNSSSAPARKAGEEVATHTQAPCTSSSSGSASDEESDGPSNG